MLIAGNPFLDFEKISRAPRVISEIRKAEVCLPWDNRPRISSELLVLFGTDRRWLVRKVLVKNGHLLLGPLPTDPVCPSGIRIPLRQLNLRAGPLPNTLSLVKGQSILLTIQTTNEKAFDLWVNLLAMELIRQTPLDCVKYFDILNLIERKLTNNNNINAVKSVSKTMHTNNNINTALTKLTDVNGNDIKECEHVDVLLKKCQNSDTYVPVKEKLKLFESLCRYRCDENIPSKSNVKKCQSMHDLTFCLGSNGVREMCKYFETKKLEDNKVKKRLINSDSNLSVKFKRNYQISYA